MLILVFYPDYSPRKLFYIVENMGWLALTGALREIWFMLVDGLSTIC